MVTQPPHTDTSVHAHARVIAGHNLAKGKSWLPVIICVSDLNIIFNLYLLKKKTQCFL